MKSAMEIARNAGRELHNGVAVTTGRSRPKPEHVQALALVAIAEALTTIAAASQDSHLTGDADRG